MPRYAKLLLHVLRFSPSDVLPSTASTTLKGKHTADVCVQLTETRPREAPALSRRFVLDFERKSACVRTREWSHRVRAACDIRSAVASFSLGTKLLFYENLPPVEFSKTITWMIRTLKFDVEPSRAANCCPQPQRQMLRFTQTWPEERPLRPEISRHICCRSLVFLGAADGLCRLRNLHRDLCSSFQPPKMPLAEPDTLPIGRGIKFLHR